MKKKKKQIKEIKHMYPETPGLRLHTNSLLSFLFSLTRFSLSLFFSLLSPSLLSLFSLDRKDSRSSRR